MEKKSDAGVIFRDYKMKRKFTEVDANLFRSLSDIPGKSQDFLNAITAWRNTFKKEPTKSAEKSKENDNA